MAKVGEGDPRWLVQSREDGKNVNNWHWEEKDITQWCKAKLTEALTNVTLFEFSQGEVRTASTIEFSGEATANNRKGKTIFYYELNVSVQWNGTLQDETAKGKVNLPYISEENSDDDQEITITLDGNSVTGRTLLEKARTYGIPMLRERVVMFLRAMREEFQRKPQISPQPDRPESAAAAPVTTTATTVAAPAPEVKKVVGVRVLNMTEEFACRPNDLYETLTNPQRIMAFTQAGATFEPTPGGKFSLFNGVVFGEIVELRPNEKIVEKWRFSDWPEGHFSTVTIDLRAKPDGGTTLQLAHAGVPPDDLDRTREGWSNNIFERIRMVFGFGPSRRFF